MFDARAVLGIVLYFKEKILKPLRKDGYLNRCNMPQKHGTLLCAVFLLITEEWFVLPYFWVVSPKGE